MADRGIKLLFLNSARQAENRDVTIAPAAVTVSGAVARHRQTGQTKKDVGTVDTRDSRDTRAQKLQMWHVPHFVKRSVREEDLWAPPALYRIIFGWPVFSFG